MILLTENTIKTVKSGGDFENITSAINYAKTIVPNGFTLTLQLGESGVFNSDSQIIIENCNLIFLKLECTNYNIGSSLLNQSIYGKKPAICMINSSISVKCNVNITGTPDILNVGIMSVGTNSYIDLDDTKTIDCGGNGTCVYAIEGGKIKLYSCICSNANVGLHSKKGKILSISTNMSNISDNTIICEYGEIIAPYQEFSINSTNGIICEGGKLSVHDSSNLDENLTVIKGGISNAHYCPCTYNVTLPSTFYSEGIIFKEQEE